MNVYENGAADERQSDSATAPASLFRKRYRQLSAEEVALHDAIKDKADELANLFFAVKANDEFRDVNIGLAIQHLEDGVYRAVKALTA